MDALGIDTGQDSALNFLDSSTQKLNCIIVTYSKCKYTLWFIKKWQHICDHNSGKSWWILIIFIYLKMWMNALCKQAIYLFYMWRKYDVAVTFMTLMSCDSICLWQGLEQSMIDDAVDQWSNTYGSLSPSSVQTASRTVQPFLHSSLHSVPILYNGPSIPLKIGPSNGGSGVWTPI